MKQPQTIIYLSSLSVFLAFNRTVFTEYQCFTWSVSDVYIQLTVTRVTVF